MVTRLGVALARGLAAGLAGGLLTACATGGTAQPPRPRPAPATPIAHLNTAGMDLHRIRFCDLLPHSAVTDALGGRATEREKWGFGDATRFVGGTGDRAQEFGCRFRAGSTVAEAWVLATPVDSRLARRLVDDAVHERGCRETTGPTFGTPSVEQLCRRPGDGSSVLRVRHAGLFDQTWLSCQVSAALPRAQVVRRSGAWCVQVANALNTAH